MFEGENLLDRAVSPVFTGPEILQKANDFAVKNVMISSVAAPDAVLLNDLNRQLHVIEFHHGLRLPFENMYRTPESQGKDRLAAVAGAIALFPGAACIVIDGGTCIKYEVLTADGKYLGGNIAPGLRMRTKAMHHFTARLPEVETALPDDEVGYSTETALQNGAFRGLLLEIEGFVTLFEKKVDSNLKVILTGGDAAFLSEHLHLKNMTLEPDLTLIGLNETLLMCL